MTQLIFSYSANCLTSKWILLFNYRAFIYIFTCLLVSAQNYGYHIDGHGHIRAREQTMILGKFSHSKIIRMTIHILHHQR